MSLIALLGRQPELGLAELESLLPGKVIRNFAHFAEIDTEFSPHFANRLGGTVKLLKLLTELNTTKWQDIHTHLVKTTPDHEQYVPEGKLTIGLSAYGVHVSKQELGRTSLAVKKAVREMGRSVRLVPNTGTAMSSAQILHNSLTGERGWELVAIRDGQRTLLCQTMWEQDIIAYAKRDQARPMRDARVGMLPPKLAQTIINLAHPEHTGTVLDPFCGTGVLLQEAALMGYKVYGTDIEPRMIEYTEKNLDWLEERFRTPVEQKLEVGDATTHTWTQPINAVACETTLGKPMSGKPSESVIRDEIARVQQILKKALQNLARQLEPGTPCCFAVPAWFYNGKVHSLPLIDQIEDLGYTFASFQHVSAKHLIYRREDQIVGRQLLAVKRK